MSVYLRPGLNEPLTKPIDEMIWDDYVRIGFEIATIISCLAYLLIEQSIEIRNQGIYSFLHALVSRNPQEIHSIKRLIIQLLNGCSFTIQPRRSSWRRIYWRWRWFPADCTISERWKRPSSLQLFLPLGSSSCSSPGKWQSISTASIITVKIHKKISKLTLILDTST